MDDLIAKLTNLGYEFFGVILPGLIAEILFVIWLCALGALVPLLTMQEVQAIDFFKVLGWFVSADKNVFAVLVLALIAAYFLGHLILWSSRAGKSDVDYEKLPIKRLVAFLRFKNPKPISSYGKDLQPLYEVVQKSFCSEGNSLSWVQFYPVVKCYISRNLASSLIATYQNKYTLHRSITSISAAWFWLCLSALVVGRVYMCLGYGGPVEWFLIVQIVFSLFFVWGFSSSYMYHWRMFGNTVITESYSLILGPKNRED